MKIKISLGEHNRYVDLMGDPIHQNKIASTLLTEEFAGAVLAGGLAAMATPNDPVYAAIDMVVSNAEDILFNRFVSEKIVLGFFDRGLFLSRATLNNICIDKNPTEQQSIDSVTKHGSHARYIKYMYLLGTVISSIYMISKLLNPESDQNALNYVSELVRRTRGVYRASKLLSGEWAIVSMPKEQEKIKEHIEFTVPDFIKLPSPAPQPAREML